MWEQNKKFLYIWLFFSGLGLIIFRTDITGVLAWSTVWGIFVLIGMPVASFIDDAMMVQKHKADEIREAKKAKKSSD